MDEQGFEPWTFRMQSGRSTTELHTLLIKTDKPNKEFLKRSQEQEKKNVHSRRTRSHRELNPGLLRDRQGS